MKQIKRPLNFFVVSWILGLIGGTLYVKDIQGWPFFGVLIGGVLISCYYFFGKKQLIVLLISFLLGVCMLVLHPTTRYVGKFEENKIVTLTGTVQDIQSTDYSQNLILNHITIGKNKKEIPVKLQVQVPLEQPSFRGELVKITGKIVSFPTPMNPSDFNYGQYLKSQNIVAVIKAKQCVSLGGKANLLMYVRNHLSRALEEIFNGTDEGVMQAALLGDDTELADEVQNLYSSAGIGHILCVSGFHVALVTGFLLSFAAYIGMPYSKRYIFSISGIWLYAVLTGLAASTVRASIMATIVMAARILWEEEDLWISIGVSAFLILVWRPYSIFNMGFQLSFSAVGAIGISQYYLRRWEKEAKELKKNVMKILIPWLIISLLTGPIIAFHYFEVPVLSSLLNLIVIPIFSLLIILGWCVLGLYLIHVPIIWPAVKGITVLLQAMRYLCEIATKLPLGTICTGRPSVSELIIYYSFLVLIGLKFYGFKLSKKVYSVSSMVLGVYLIINLLMPHLLQVTYLYVGQGDGSIIETPHQHIIAIDGGPPGKGQVMERYIKFRGKKTVEALMVSHSDSDHIGGIIELVQSDLKIKRVIISYADESELLETLKSACQEKKIQIMALGAAERFVTDGVTFKVLAPKTVQSDINNNSLVCLATYKRFKALFTGDKEKDSESSIYNDMGPISLLKVSHHGSRTGTEEKLLLKLQPQYAMISCGINNRYGHPHEEVLDALATCEVPYERTDLQGAIWVRTDGEKMTLYTQKERAREED